ncbi:peptidase M16 [Clostridium acetobutylicum]|nr:peptidase M16 [Clostridium acetobutylicum]
MNCFKKDSIYHGFKFVSEEDINEINSKAFMFEHVKSGARLLYLQNEDKNKVFSISFRTPPKDSTGVFHILEHSVLCGSDKYPVKEPFVELLKGSLNTFLNAFTFSDKTMYPVASQNDKDFLNLMDVYLDAVFHPNIYKYEEIFQQEGWHYELNSKDENISYKGVVYNEMKGAFSSPEGVLMRKIQNSLFPDNTYGFESGGDPDDIPDLTYDAFLDSHKKYYSPSNSYIYLYGDMDIEEKLKYIDEEYLKNYDRIEVDSKIEPQKPIGKLVESSHEYPILQDEGEKDKTYLSLNFVVSSPTDNEKYLAFDMLEYILLESEAAPLKKAIIKAGLGKDVFGIYDNGIMQTYFSVIVKNSNEERKEEFKKLVFDTLNDLVKNGIDKKLIEAAINIREFELREADFKSYPRGLGYSIKTMDSWLYDANPTNNLRFEDALKNIKKSLTENYFEKLIEDYLINSNHSSLVIVKPSKTVEVKKSKKESEELSSLKSSLSDEELNKIISDTKKLRERQTSEDSEEDLRKIPMLSLKDVNKEVEKLPLEEKEEDKIKVLYHNVFTNKILYLRMYFESGVVKYDDLPYLGLLENILGKVNTEKYKYEDLANEINIKTGDISFENNLFTSKDDDKDYTTKFVCKTKVIMDKVGDAFQLIDEIIYHSLFDDEKRIKEIIQEMRSRLEMIINQSGNSIAAIRLKSYFSPSGEYSERLNGISFYKFICNLDENFSEKFDEVKNKLKGICDTIFNKDNVIISVTGNDEVYNKFKEQLPKIKLKSFEVPAKSEEYNKVAQSNNEGLITSSKVQYAAKGFNFRRLGYDYSGKMKVLKSIISLSYLWNNVRVMGGAYGCSAYIQRNGSILFASYRDPNLTETLKIYDEVYKYIENFNADDYEMTKYILGTISSIDQPLLPKQIGQKSDSYYFNKLTYEDLQKERDEILSTKKEEIKSYSKLLKDVMEQNYICVLGNDVKITENKDIFGRLINVFE